MKAKFCFWGGGILKGTGNREQGTGDMPCSPSVPGTCSGTTPGKPIAEKLDPSEGVMDVTKRILSSVVVRNAFP